MTSHRCLAASTSNSAPRLKSLKESDWLSLDLVANGLEQGAGSQHQDWEGGGAVKVGIPGC